jgi:hypothetical protein
MERVNDVVEYYLDDKLFIRLFSSITPEVGEKINIGKKIYEVVCRSYCVDYSERVIYERQMRCNVEIAVVP